MAPTAVPEAPLDTLAVQMTTNAPESAPEPSVLAMQLVLEVISFDQVPIGTNPNPLLTTPAFQNSQAVQVTANAPRPSIVPTGWSVVVVTLVQVPVRTNMAPVSMPEAAENAASVEMMTNSLEFAPEPAVPAMQFVPILVPSPQLPVAALDDPATASPTLQDALAVLMVTHPPESTPVPARTLVVVVSPPQMPVRADTTPPALDIAPQDAHAITMHTDALEASPSPLTTAMVRMIVFVLSVEVPVLANRDPATSIPSAENALPVLMSANAAETTPEPTTWLGIVVAFPQVPVCSHAAPMALTVAPECTSAIEMDTNAPVASPTPSGLAVVNMVVVVSAIQMPV